MTKRAILTEQLAITKQDKINKDTTMMVHVYMCKCMYVCAFMQMCNSTVKNMRLFNYAISYYTCYNSCSLSFKIALYDASYCVVVYVYQ